MANYFISFDLPEMDNEQERVPIAARIHEQFGAVKTFQFTKNGWFINTDWHPDDIRTWLLNEIHPSRQGIVIRITDPMYGVPSDSDLPEWLLLDYHQTKRPAS